MEPDTDGVPVPPELQSLLDRGVITWRQLGQLMGHPDMTRPAGPEGKPAVAVEPLGEVLGHIVGELYHAFAALGVDSQLLGVIGSWGDTLPEARVLSGLHAWNAQFRGLTPDQWTAVKDGKRVEGQAMSGEKWRLLGPGDVTQPGDEVLKYAGTWSRLGNPCVLGLTLRGGIESIFRRRVTPAEEHADELLSALRTLTDLCYDRNADPKARADAEYAATVAIAKTEGRAAS